MDRRATNRWGYPLLYWFSYLAFLIAACVLFWIVLAGSAIGDSATLITAISSLFSAISACVAAAAAWRGSRNQERREEDNQRERQRERQLVERPEMERLGQIVQQLEGHTVRADTQQNSESAAMSFLGQHFLSADPEAQWALLPVLNNMANRPAHRQDVVNVICALLRAPAPVPDVTDDYIPSERWEVRRHAQRILVDILRHQDQSQLRLELVVKLGGAILVDFNASRCNFMSDIVDFGGVTFAGETSFHGATFGRERGEGGRSYISPVEFRGADFVSVTDFSAAVFRRDADFESATFLDTAYFSGAVFCGANFRRATFGGGADFREVTAEDRYGVVLDSATVADVRCEYIFPPGWQVMQTENFGGRLVKATSTDH